MDNRQEVRKILLWLLAANLAVAASKIIIGQISGSASLTADGYHSVSDGFSNISGLVGLHLAARPRDRNHPYGHKKFENITGLFIGGTLLVMSGNIILEALARLNSPVRPQITGLSVLALVLTLAVNIAVAFYEHKKGVQLNSDLLLADALHTKSDIFVSCGVLFALVALDFGAPAIIDPLASLVVVGFILWAAWGVARKTSAVLLDEAAVEVERIRAIAHSFPDVRGAHAIRSRRAGDDIYIDMHVYINPEMSVKDAHSLVHEIEAKFKDELASEIQLLIHVEPDKRTR